jgi:DNA-binding NtrC family response regulator
MATSHGDEAETSHDAQVTDLQPVVLIVDADESSRIIYSELLQHAGVRALAMSTCEAGVQLLRQCVPAAVLVDPASCGDSADELLASARGRGIPVLAITSMGTADDLATLKGGGYAAALLKPTILQDVLTAVQNATNIGRKFRLSGA